MVALNNMTRSRQDGALLIEILVTIVLLAIGLLGLMQMQGRLQRSEMESYQRTQAVLLARDMASRIEANRSVADRYETTALTPLGVGAVCGDPTDTDASMQEVDSAEWCLALQGAAELSGGNRVGSMIGARGCVEALPGSEYMVTVVWQGLTPISAPPPEDGTSIGVTCGAGEYNSPPGSDCAEPANADRCRRYVTTKVRIGNLTL